MSRLISRFAPRKSKILANQTKDCENIMSNKQKEIKYSIWNLLILFGIILLGATTSCVRTEYQYIPVTEQWDPVFVARLDNDWQVLMEYGPRVGDCDWLQCRIQMYEPNQILEDEPKMIVYGTWTIQGSAHYYDYQFSTPGFELSIYSGQLEDWEYEDLIFYIHSYTCSEYSFPFHMGNDTVYLSRLELIMSLDEPYQNPGNTVANI